MKKFIKPVLIILSFAALLYLVLFSEKREEDTSLITLWKIDIDEVIYHPPKDKNQFENFLTEKIKIKRNYPDIKSTPLFTVESIDRSENYLYEGNYNSKNLLRELSLPKTVFLQDMTEDLKKRFSISESSPVLEAYKDGKLQKRIYIGDPDRNNKYRFALSENEIFKLYGFSVDRFTKTIFGFRDRSVFYTGDNYIENIYIKTGETEIYLKELARENNKKDSIWYRENPKKIQISPLLGKKLKSSIQTFSINKFADEDKEGVQIIKELIKTTPILKIELTLSNSITYIAEAFPKVEMEGKSYNPIITKIKNRFEESPYYTDNSNIINFESLIDQIKNAKEWKPPIPKKSIPDERAKK